MSARASERQNQSAHGSFCDRRYSGVRGAQCGRTGHAEPQSLVSGDDGEVKLLPGQWIELHAFNEGAPVWHPSLPSRGETVEHTHRLTSSGIRAQRAGKHGNVWSETVLIAAEPKAAAA